MPEYSNRMPIGIAIRKVSRIASKKIMIQFGNARNWANVKDFVSFFITKKIRHRVTAQANIGVNTLIKLH